MAEQKTIDHLVGLAVAMLGVAPGTKWLNDRAKDIDGGKTLDDVANQIQSSTGFEDKYPAFLSDRSFVEDFLGDLFGGHVTDGEEDDDTDNVLTTTVDYVTGLIRGGTSRGEVAVLLVDALMIIAGEGGSEEEMAFRELHSETFGKAAAAFHNKVMVAKHYTEEARKAEPSSSVLEGVTDAAESVSAAINLIDNPPAPAVPMEGRTFDLTPTIDDFEGTAYDDTFVAQLVQGSNNLFQDVLNPFDTIDGGGGADTIHIFGTDPDESLSLGAEDVSNVENVSINTVGGIDADLTDWSGLESVHLRRLGDESDVEITVDDGATITSDRKFGGEKATLVGASGAVDIEASGDTAVHIGSAGETESVKVKGGASVLVDNGAGRQSQTVTSVSVDGVKGGTMEDGTLVPNADVNGFLVGQNGSTPITITHGGGTAGGDSGTTVNLVSADADGTLKDAVDDSPIRVTYATWNDDGDSGHDATENLNVIVELKVDVDTGGLMFGKITAIVGITAADDGSFTIDDGGDDERIIKPDALDGMSVPAGVAYVSQAIKTKDADPTTETVGAKETLTVKSDAIAEVHLHNTRAIALVENQSKTDTGGAQPEDLAVTVDGYGTVKNGRAVATEEGKLCVKGTGEAKDIDITVAGASNFRLASDKVESLDINAGAALWLKVHKFDDKTVSTSLKSITVEGEGGVTMNGLNGMSNLASIDAGESSGKNSFKSTGEDAELAKLKTAMGGSGSDTFALTTSLRGNLESVQTGEGNDVVMMGGDYRDEGLKVDLGAGDDTFHGSEGNSESHIDGGEGRDTLRLTSDGATYKDGTKTKSIYENFEILDLGGGSGTYDVGRLGVDTIEVKENTGAGGTTLNNVGAGTTVRVEAKGAGMGTRADVKYNFASDVNTAGSLIDGGTTNILNVSLMAKGGTKAGPGAAELTITLDEDLVAMTIDSDASVHRTAAGKGVTSRHYENKVTVVGTSSALEEVKITGDAQTNLGGTGLTSLEYVNAAESGAGVTVNANVADSARVRLVGSNHDDELTSGDFNNSDSTTLAIRARNTLEGNGGDDELTGGAGRDIIVGGAGADTLMGGVQEDRFVYNAASESQVSFSRNSTDSSIYDAKGYDVIEDFATTTDKLHFSKALHAIVTAGDQATLTGANNLAGTTNTADNATIANGIKMDAAEWTGWKPVDNDGTPGGPTTSTTSIDGDGKGRNDGDNGGTPDGGAANLFDFINDGRGLFLTSTTSTGTFGTTTRTYKNSIAVISQTGTNSKDEHEGQGTWLLFDIDADGNFDAETDMVIFLAGAASTTFAPGTDITS